MTELLDFESRLKQCFNCFRPGIIERRQRHAAVLVPIVKEPAPAVLLTVRAAHLKSHPGQVSFPGGMYEPGDESVAHTALRETFEEISLPADRFDVVGELSTACSKDGVLVYPIVGIAQNAVGCSGNPEEIEDIFSVPWHFFLDSQPEFRLIERHGIRINVPHFYYQNRHIWGLTAMILLELVNLVEGTNYPLPDFTQAKR